MAAPTDINAGRSVANEAMTQELSSIRAQLNNAIAAIRIIAAKLDADAGVTDTTYFALSCDSAVATAPAKVLLSQS